MSCAVEALDLLQNLESGVVAHPVFFAGPNCQGNKWPNHNTPFNEGLISNDDLLSNVCSTANSTGINCPVPLIRSIIFPQSNSSAVTGIQIQFVANTIGVQNNQQVSTEPYIAEYGSTNIYSSNCSTNGICTDIGSTLNNEQFTWFSGETSGCENPGEEGGCSNSEIHTNRVIESKNNNCRLVPPSSQTIDPLIYWDTKEVSKNPSNKMLQTMVSCGSNLYPSFIGVDVRKYALNSNNVGVWDIATTNNSGSDGSDYNLAPVDICNPGLLGYPLWTPDIGNHMSLEKETIQSIYINPNNKQTGTLAIQGNGCLGTFTQAKNGEAGSVIKHQSDGDGGFCSNDVCGLCTVSSSDTSNGKWYNQCGSLSSPHVRGSVGKMQINYVDENKNIISWVQLQGLYCTNGVSVAGINVQRYGQGTFVCDEIMEEVCSNTATLTNSPSVLESCGCIIEQKRLETQFTGLDLPVQCFSTVCSLNNSDVYKTSDQIEGCSARLCTQTLQVNGSQLLARGFQEITCNGEVYNVAKVGEVEKVPLVSQPDVNAPSVTVGPILYIGLIILGVMIVLSIIWGIRRLNIMKRQKREEKQQIQDLLLQTIK